MERDFSPVLNISRPHPLPPSDTLPGQGWGVDAMSEDAGNPYSSSSLSSLSPLVNAAEDLMVVNWSETTTEVLNYSREEYMATFLGARYISSAAVVCLTLIYAIIFMMGLLGNVFTCIVIARNKFMHTATNYYLFSLAISDVITLVLALPPDVASIWEAYPWHFGEVFCFIKSFVSELTAYASVLTITAFTVERYLAICHPLHAQKWSSPSRAVKLIVCLWCFACLVALPYPLHTRLFYGVYNPHNETIPLEESLLCNIPPYWRKRMQVCFQVSTFLFFVAPMIIITLMYTKIGLALCAQRQFMEDKKNKTALAASNKTRRAVLKMLVAVVIAFFVCWAPFHAQRLMTIYITQWTEPLMTLQNYVFYISGVLFFVSSTVNPILYNLMSRRYRKAFKRTLCRCLLKDEMGEVSLFRSSPSRATNISVYYNNKLQTSSVDRRTLCNGLNSTMSSAV